MHWSWAALLAIPILVARGPRKIFEPHARATTFAIVLGWTLLGVSGIVFGALGIVVAALVLLGIASLLLLQRQYELEKQLNESERLKSVALRNADQVSVLSHEIRTPLTLVKGAALLLAEQTPGPLNERQARFVNTITQNSETMIELAEDLLMQARIDAGLFELKLKRVDLRALTRDVVRDLREVNGKNISLDCQGAPPRVWADPKLIVQAVTNLINNAFAASQEGAHVTVRVETREDDALISVTDNGQGMSLNERQKMFERFVSGRPLKDGTGIGLTITRQIIAMHGGTMHVDTIARQGTTMMLTLPSTEPERIEGAA